MKSEQVRVIAEARLSLIVAKRKIGSVMEQIHIELDSTRHKDFLLEESKYSMSLCEDFAQVMDQLEAIIESLPI